MAADVSIIVPAYNMERFLVETLDSIEAAIKPTSLAVEVIVMDDGSTDGSLALARNYAAHHANIRVLTQPNAGPSVARNRAINEATGRYIFPLDADDLLGAGFLEHAVQILDTDPEVKAVCGEDLFFGEKQGPWRLPRFSRTLLARRNLICVSALYRRTDWERVGGYCEELVGYEDWDFWLSIFKGGGQSRAIILSGHSLSHSQRLEAHRRPQTQTRNNRLAEPPSCGIFRTSALRTAALSTYMVETAESADEMGS